MSEDKKYKQNQQVNQDSAFTGAGSAGPIGGVSSIDGMSPAERVQYIQQIQKLSPLARIVESVKKLNLSDMGLGKAFFEAGAGAIKSLRDSYKNLRQKQNINQHIADLTENVAGMEQIKHEMDPGANVDLVDGMEIDKKKGLYVDLDWAPKQKGIVE